MSQTTTVTQWCRKRTVHAGDVSIETTEFLDVHAAERRLLEAIRERGDAGVMAWLDIALNGWGDEEDRP